MPTIAALSAAQALAGAQPPASTAAPAGSGQPVPVAQQAGNQQTVVQQAAAEQASAPAATGAASGGAARSSRDQLQEVVVSAVRVKPISLKEPDSTASRLNLTPLETPSSIQSVSGDLVRLEGQQSVVQAATQATGVTVSSTNNGGAWTVRGFAGTDSVMRLLDGTRMYVTGGTITFPFDTWSVDRIDVLSGAASVLYGEGAIGGAINIVSKQPTQGPIQNEVEVDGGSDSTFREAVDSSGGITNQLSYRVDLSNSHSDGWLPNDQSSNQAFAGALRYAPLSTLQFTLSEDYGNQMPGMYYGVPLVDGHLDRALRYVDYDIDGAYDEFIDRWTRFDAVWQPAAGLTLHSEFYYLSPTRVWSNDARTYTYNPATETVTRGGSQNLHYSMGQTGNRTYVDWQSHPFGLENDASLGFDANRLNYNRNLAFEGRTSVVSAFDYYPAPFPAVDASPETLYRIRVRAESVFGEDRLKLTDRWSLVAGLRWDFVYDDSINPTALFTKTFSPLSSHVGAVFQYTPDLSFYASYSTAVDPLTDLFSLTTVQSNFKMASGRQVEAGMKQQFDADRGDWTLALYDIVKNNLLEQQTLGAASNPDVFDQVGEQSSHGIELSYGYAITNTLRIDANGALLIARFNDFQAEVSGKLVSYDDNLPPDVPESTANLWLTWQFLPRWQAMIGEQEVGSRFADDANTERMPGYAVTNLNVSWSATRDLLLTARFDNLFNRFYAQWEYSGQAVIGPPFYAELGIDWRF